MYDHDGNPLPALEEPHVRSALGDVRGYRVLDLGCGTGRHTAWLARAGAHATAVDFSEQMLEQARRKLHGADVVSAMHPAMFLRDSRARFTDPDTGEVIAPGSVPHGLGDFVMAAVRAGFALTDIGEYAPDAGFVREYPRAASYEVWPMLVVLAMEASTRPTRTATP